MMINQTAPLKATFFSCRAFGNDRLVRGWVGDNPAAAGSASGVHAISLRFCLTLVDQAKLPDIRDSNRSRSLIGTDSARSRQRSGL